MIVSWYYVKIIVNMIAKPLYKHDFGLLWEKSWFKKLYF